MKKMKINFKEYPQNEMPRERLLHYGASHLSNEELIAIILRTGDKQRNVKELASYLLFKIGKIENFKSLTYHHLLQIEGIGPTKAIELLAIIEFGKRIYLMQEISNKRILNSPITIIQYFNDLFKDKKQEEFYVVYLDTKKKLIDKYLLFRGTINSSIVHPREIFKQAYLLSADSMICVHNHPSGDVNPSVEDIHLTKKIQEISQIHGIKFIDHIIIGKDSYFSFFENNMMKTL